MPRVAVRNSPRKPMRPREGTRNSRRARPKPGFSIFVMRPRRVESRSVVMPTYASGTSTTTSSIGSMTSSSMVRVMTSGLESCIS